MNPKNSKRKILIIGGVAAGTSAASKARRTDSNADIKIIQEESLVAYGSCGMPYVIEGKINNFNKLIARSIEEFKNKYNIEIFVNTKAVRIDTFKKRVYTKNLQDKKRKIFDYTSLIITTGARSVIPKIKGLSLDNQNKIKGIFFLRNFEDGVNIQNYLKNVKSIIVVGTGLIGSEMVEAFRLRGKSVIFIGNKDRILANILDKDMAEIVVKELYKNGIKVILDEKVEQILFHKSENKNSPISIEGIQTSKEKIYADCVLFGVGIKPNSEIASEAGIKLGIHDAIKVDEYMRTNVADVYAAGDCATAYNYVTKTDTYLPLGTTANKQGRIAGENAAGGNTKFAGIAGSAITKIFGLYVGKTGLNKEEALKNGFDPVEHTIEDITRAGYYPDNKKLWIKLIADKKSRKVLGAQIVGGEAVKGRLDLISFALLKHASVDDLKNYDACYVPPVSPVWEPINIAAAQISKLLSRSTVIKH
ncbi:MAG: pyridine nucleotide-disulfide oxidoreductase [Nitrososphaeraceae archaeon]|nr:pyridine nucleotide-disulfide oxidoreductase [Nitrososphaeraceae archaeon]